MADIEKIRKMINEELANWDLPSIGVGIVKDGEVVLAEGFGMANIEKNLASNPDALYQIGSCSKAFTAAACAKLVDMGKLEWDKPIHHYMPWVEFKDPFTTMNVTVRDLLCHRTGLPRHDAYWINGPQSRYECVYNLRNMNPAWSFRSHWCYQNTCFVLAGMLVETLSGKSWEEFVQEEIFNPLGMTRSFFYVDDIANDDNASVGYGRVMPTDLTGWKRVDFLKSDREDKASGVGAPYGPAGSIISTVNDMLKWVQFNLNNGKAGDTQVISEENMKELHKAQMLMSAALLVPFPEEDMYAYGMGWFIEMYRGHYRVQHGGNINGYTALVTMIPDQNLGIVTLINFDNGFMSYGASYQITDEFLGVEGGDWNNRWREIVKQVFASAPEQMKMLRGEKIEGTSPSHDLDAFTGTFRNATYGDVVIGKDENGLTFTYNKASSPMEHFHYDTFTITDVHHLLSGMNVLFKTDKTGTVNELDIGITLEPTLPDEVFIRIKEEA